MRAENDWATAVGVGRIQDKTRWTKALGGAATVLYGDCNEVIDLRKYSSTSGHETTRRYLMLEYPGVALRELKCRADRIAGDLVREDRPVV